MKLVGHKIRLRPNARQEEFFRQCVGTARFAYNLALGEWQSQYRSGKKPNECALRREINSRKRAEWPWMMDVPKSVVQQAVKNVGDAYGKFFKKLARYPKFKKRGKGRESARLDNGPGTFSFLGKSVTLPKIGRVTMFEKLRFDGIPKSAILRREGGRWFLSVAVEVKSEVHSEIGQPAQQNCQGENQALPSVGVDLGLTSALTLSTGEKIAPPQPLKRNIVRLRRLSRSLSRKVEGSSNWRKAKQRLNRCHWHIGEVRRNWQHQVTTRLSRRFGLVCLEDLNVKGMMRSNLARAIADVGWGELVRQFSYKTRVQKVGRFYPSSKTCSCCGAVVDDLPLDVRVWTCASCGAGHDRDVNASQNILREGLRLAASCAVTACGEVGSGASAVPARVKPASTKQEHLHGRFVHA
jgi:putative transposase